MITTVYEKQGATPETKYFLSTWWPISRHNIISFILSHLFLSLYHIFTHLLLHPPICHLLHWDKPTTTSSNHSNVSLFPPLASKPPRLEHSATHQDCLIPLLICTSHQLKKNSSVRKIPYNYCSVRNIHACKIVQIADIIGLIDLDWRERFFKPPTVSYQLWFRQSQKQWSLRAHNGGKGNWF